MPNTETVHLDMTPREADGVAYVLMSSLRLVSMLDRERDETTAVANELFKQLGYGHATDSRGNRVETVK